MNLPEFKRTVTVYLDGKHVMVPEKADCHHAARGALGVSRGVAVAYERDPLNPLAFEGGHVFVNGDRFVTVVCGETMTDESVQADLKTMRTLIQRMGWASFMSHVGSLMAEQSDKTDDKTGGALAAGSRMIHSLPDLWVACGRFTYPPELVSE